MRNLGSHGGPEEYLLAHLHSMVARSVAPRGIVLPYYLTSPTLISPVQDYTLVVASIVKGKCPQWTLLAKGNYVTPYCGGHGTSSPTEFLTIHQLPPQQGKRVSSVQGQPDKRELARDDGEKPSSPPYASGLITSTVYATGSVTSTASSTSGPAIETASSSTSSVTKTGSSSSAVGTIPPTELVKLIAPLFKQVEQIEAELRQAKGQLRKLDPNNPLAMGGAEEDESKEDSKQSEEKPNTDRRRAESVDEEPEKDLDDDLRNLMDPVLFIPHSKPQSPEEIIDDPLDPFEFDLEHIWESKSQNTKRQFPPGPAPKFDTASGQTVASLTQRITKLTEELKVAKWVHLFLLSFHVLTVDPQISIASLSHHAKTSK